MNYSMGRMMLLGGFGLKLFAVLVREFCLAFIPRAFIGALLQQNPLLTFLTVASTVSVFIAAAGFGITFLSGGGIPHLASAILLVISPFINSLLSGSFAGFGNMNVVPNYGGLSFVTLLSIAIPVLYLLPWAWKYKDKNILISAMLAGAFVLELLVPIIFPSLDRFRMNRFFSIILAIVYVGCAAVPAFAAFCEDED